MQEILAIRQSLASLICDHWGDTAFFGLLFPEKGEIYSQSGPTARIAVRGPLSAGSGIMELLTGAVQYSDIREAIARAEGDESVTDIQLVFDSPGGSVDGLDETALAIGQCSKPITAHVENTCASAAYWLASQADSITANVETAMVGSIGIMAQVPSVDDNSIVTVTSTASPKKHIDVSTDDGVAQVRARLDDVMSIFARRVADGRGVEIEKVLSDFGQGDLLIAKKAKDVGMIDDVIGTSTNSKQQDSEEIMSEKVPQHDNGAAVQKAFQDGIAQERTRVTRLMAWARTDAALDLVKQCIANGSAQEDMLAELTSASQVSPQYVQREQENPADVQPEQVQAQKADPDADANALHSEIVAMMNTYTADASSSVAEGKVQHG